MMSITDSKVYKPSQVWKSNILSQDNNFKSIEKNSMYNRYFSEVQNYLAISWVE